MNELFVNLSPKRIDHRYLKILIVAQAFVAPVLGKLFAVKDRLSIGVELNADLIPHGNAVLHIEEKNCMEVISVVV